MATPAPWNFTLGLSARPTRCVATVRADGYQLDFPWAGRLCQVVVSFFAPGVMVGKTDAPLMPSLFAPKGDVKRSSDAEWWEGADEHVALVRMPKPGGLHFALAAGYDSHPATMARARAALSQDAAALFEEGRRLRQTWYNRMETIPFGAEELCVRALESLWARAELPIESLPHAWCATSLNPNPSLDVDHLFVLGMAWTKLAVHVAEDMVRAVFLSQRRDGSVPCRIEAGGTADYSRAPLPLLAQTILHVANAGGHSEFARAMMGPLKSYLEWALNLFDPQASGKPQPDHEHTWWMAQPFGLIPHPVGLALMLLSELEAFDALAEIARSADVGAFEARAEALKLALGTTYWQSDLNTYVDLDDSGNPWSSRTTTAALLCLRSARLSPVHQDAVLRQWEHHFAEYASETVNSQNWCALILDTLRCAEAHALATRYSGLIWRHLQESMSSATAPAVTEPFWLDAAGAGLVLLLALPSSPPRHAGHHSTTRILNWCDTHATSFIGVMAGVPALIALTIICASLFKKSPPLTDAAVSVGFAQQLYMMGYYHEAAAIYERLLSTGPRVAPLQFLLGKAYYYAGDLANAEKYFRAALTAQERSPAAMLNLALTLYRQGRLEESLDLYAQVAGQYADRFPELALRAEFVLQLLKSSPSATTNDKFQKAL